MLVYPSLADRTASLEAIVRHALLFGELSAKTADTVYGISQQPDLTSDELRMLDILNDALTRGYVERRD